MANTALWNKKELNYQIAEHKRHFPTEFVLRALLSPAYFKNFKQVEHGQTVLDIGCLYANNLVPFVDRGCAAFGVEVTEDGVIVARENAAQQNIEAHIEQGTNSALPFDDEFFDFVLSINTIHYEDNKDGVIAGLTEMKRVLKPGGCLLISTAGQEHNFVSTAQKNGPNDYTVQKEGDFRCGEHFTFFDGPEDFKNTLNDVFDKTETAVITESYPQAPLQFYIGKCIK